MVKIDNGIKLNKSGVNLFKILVSISNLSNYHLISVLPNSFNF